MQRKTEFIILNFEFSRGYKLNHISYRQSFKIQAEIFPEPVYKFSKDNGGVIQKPSNYNSNSNKIIIFKNGQYRNQLTLTTVGDQITDFQITEDNLLVISDQLMIQIYGMKKLEISTLKEVPNVTSVLIIKNIAIIGTNQSQITFTKIDIPMNDEIRKKKFIEFEGKFLPIKTEPEELQKMETTRKRSEFIFKRRGLRRIQRLAHIYKTDYHLNSDSEEEKMNGTLIFPGFNISIKIQDRTKSGNLRKKAYQLLKEYVRRIKIFEEINKNNIPYIYLK